jgi:hypothetical protein
MKMICFDYLVEIFLPLADKAGETFPTERFSRVMEVLKRKFGGVTVYDRSPAKRQNGYQQRRYRYFRSDD